MTPTAANSTTWAALDQQGQSRLDHFAKSVRSRSARTLIIQESGSTTGKEIVMANAMKQQMSGQDYSASITANITAQEATERINRVADWWSVSFTGASDKVGDAFTVRFGETFVDFAVVELVPAKRIVWRVTDCNLHFIEDKKEWKDTRVVFDISSDGPAATVTMTHAGLVPAVECYENCRTGWDFYITKSLQKFLTENQGIPDGRKGQESAEKEEATMPKVIFGNHSSVIVPRQDRDSIRKFYCDILGGKITKAQDERDFLLLGDNFYIVFMYGDVPDESEFLRSARSVWLEIKSDNVECAEKSSNPVSSGSLTYRIPTFTSRLPEGNASG